LVEAVESRKLVFGRRKWLVSRVWRAFLGVFGDFGAQTRHFFSFFGVTSPLREGVGVLEITPHLLNVRVLGTAHLVRRTQQPIVQSGHLFPLKEEVSNESILSASLATRAIVLALSNVASETFLTSIDAFKLSRVVWSVFNA